MVVKYRFIVAAIALLLISGIGVFYFVSDPQTSGDTETIDRQRVGLLAENTTTDFFLMLDEPKTIDLVIKTPRIVIKGRTRVDALVTVNDHVLEPDLEGRFEQSVDLAPGLNIIEILASAASGEQKAIQLGVGLLAP